MKYVTKIEIRVDVDAANFQPTVAAMSRQERTDAISAEFWELITEECADEEFTFFDVQVTTVESDD